MNKKKLENPITINPIEFNQIPQYHILNDIDNNIYFIRSVVEIIEGICNIEIPRVHIVEIDDYDDLSDMRSEIEVDIDQKILYKLTISQFNSNVLLDDNVSTAKKLDMFFYGLGIIKEISLARYIFIICHEVGHIMAWDKYKKDIALYGTVMESISNMNNALFFSGKYSMFSREFYIDSQPEANADVFAFKIFPLLWGILKERKLI